jgi:glycosyltransferase involved in cell wall biosynthesis
MGDAPRFSIVIPSYQPSRFLRDTLETVRRQTEPRWECLVVDDASTDAGVAIAQEFAAANERFRILTQPNAGPPAARNPRYRASDHRAHYVTFIGALRR